MSGLFVFGSIGSERGGEKMVTFRLVGKSTWYCSVAGGCGSKSEDYRSDTAASVDILRGAECRDLGEID